MAKPKKLSEAQQARLNELVHKQNLSAEETAEQINLQAGFTPEEIEAKRKGRRIVQHQPNR